MITYSGKHNLVLRDNHYTNIVKFVNCSHIQLSNCEFHNASLYFVNCDTISVSHCNFLRANTDHALQCNQSTDIYIGYNYFQEPIGSSVVSDIINLYKCTGATVEYNYLSGGGPCSSGGGIMLGDNMGDNQVATHNICIDCGQYGIAIAGGKNNSITYNQVYSEQHPWSNVGVYVWGVTARRSIVTDARVENNRISWKNKLGINNPLWKGSNVHSSTIQHNELNVEYQVPPRPNTVGIQLLKKT